MNVYDNLAKQTKTVNDAQAKLNRLVQEQQTKEGGKH